MQSVCRIRTASLRTLSQCVVLTGTFLSMNLVVAQKPVTLTGHDNVVSSLAFSPDGQRLFSGSWDKTVRVWNGMTGRSEAVLRGHSDWVLDVSVGRDRPLYSVSQNEILQWSTDSFRQLSRTTDLGGAVVSSAAVSATTSQVVTGGRDGFVRIRPADGGVPGIEFGDFPSWVGCVCFSGNAEILAAGTRTGAVRLFDLPSRKQRHRFDAHPGRQVLALQISPDGKTLASGGFEQTARLWNLTTGKETAAMSGHQGVVTSLAWSADGKLLATGERHGSIHIWDTGNSYRQVSKISAHTDGQLGFSVTALAFSPDGTRIASGSSDRTVRLWQVPGQ